jgi:hypothetical protein
MVEAIRKAGGSPKCTEFHSIGLGVNATFGRASYAHVRAGFHSSSIALVDGFSRLGIRHFVHCSRYNEDPWLVVSGLLLEIMFSYQLSVRSGPRSGST